MILNGILSFSSFSRQMLPLATNIREAYKNGQDDEQNFIQNLALFLCTILREHAILIEQKVSQVCVGEACECGVHASGLLLLLYLVQILGDFESSGFSGY